MKKNIDPATMTREEFEECLKWCMERIKESPTGRCSVPKYVREKFRKLTGDYFSEDWQITLKIVDLANDPYSSTMRQYLEEHGFAK